MPPARPRSATGSPARCRSSTRSTDDGPLERPLPEGITEAAPRERLRWEKELLGLYLSDHPLGELAGTIGEYVNAYSGEMGEELDQQRVCVGGVVTEVRRVITKARATMGVATLEDLQGTIEVIVFPKVFEQTEPTWAEDAILLVAGRVDHKGEETVLLADAVWTWEQATALGAQGFARGGGAWRSRPPSARRAATATPTAMATAMHASPPAAAAPAPVAVGPGFAKPGPRLIRTVPRVSPLRGGERQRDGRCRTPAARQQSSRLPRSSAPSRIRTSRSSQTRLFASWSRGESAPTLPQTAGAGQALHVSLGSGSPDELLEQMRSLREIIHEHPGETPVVLHVPAGAGRSQRMELRVRVAYDAELVATLSRLIRSGKVDLRPTD